MSDIATYWPLGVVHLIPPKDIVIFMGRIENEWKQGRIVLRGYKNETEFTPVNIIYSPNLELRWMGGPAREGGIPGFPELEYYCEVAIRGQLKGRREETINYAALRLDGWIDIEISEADLCRVLAETYPNDAESREDRLSTVAKSEPAAEHAVAAALSPSAPDAEIKTDPKPVPMPDLIKFLREHGQRPAGKLWDAAKHAFPKNAVPRDAVLRPAIVKAFGRRLKVGRPKTAE